VSSPRAVVVRHPRHRLRIWLSWVGQNGVVRDWVMWHQGYADPASGLSARLRSVQRHLSRAIDQAAAGPVRPSEPLGSAMPHALHHLPDRSSRSAKHETRQHTLGGECVRSQPRVNE